MKAYRVENQADGHGIWRNFDGSLNPVFEKLSDGLAKNLPMPDSDFYRYGGKQWFSATDTPEKLTAWFSRQDVTEMLTMGYRVFEFDITSCRVVSEYEIAFTRDSILSQREIDYAEIWKPMNPYVDVEYCKQHKCPNLQCKLNIKNILWDKYTEGICSAAIDCCGRFSHCPKNDNQEKED